MRFLLRASGIALAAAVLGHPGASGAEASDADFVAKAASGGQMEIELGSYAAKHAASSEVREFGERMALDHGKASQRLQAAAREAGLAVPTQLQEKHRQKVAELTALSGADFDRRYMASMVEDHTAEVAKFRKQAEGGDSAIDRWAKETLPTLEKHLEHARSLSEKHAERGAPADMP